MSKEPTAAFFRAYDIRGVVDKGFDGEFVESVGQAFGSEAAARGQRSVAVGRDGRLSGPGLLQSLKKGLLAAGIDVVDAGCVPTPVLYFVAHTIAGGNGVMLTGSHNPPEYNGLKMLIGGETLSGEAVQELRRRILENRLSRGPGRECSVDIEKDYIQRIVSDVNLRRPLKVVLDCGNGAAGLIAPKLLRALGCELIELFCDIDGTFPNHHPDPSQPENLRDLIGCVVDEGADIGIAFDGDGDRIGVVDPDGNVIWPDRLMMLYATDVLSRNPGAEIIYDIKCSGNLGTVIEGASGRPSMWCTGHSLIKARMRQTGALLAGEMSGHIFFKERWYGFDDALYAAARLLEILAADERPIAAVFRALPDAVNTPELRVELEEGEHFAFMDRLAARSEYFTGARLTRIDGLRADYDDGWGLVRASNTTPSLVLRFEAKDGAVLKRIQEQFKALMLAIRPDLHLPF